MSDDEDETMTNGGVDGEQTKENGGGSSSSDDSSSSSSGSSSSSDSSDSESDGEQENPQQDQGDRKDSMDSAASSARSSTRMDLAEPIIVNSNRAAARFREQNQEGGLMALGTKKRDRRTIEEIQRDLKKNRGRAGSNGSSLLGGGLKKPPTGAVPRVSPPKGSPALSPEAGGPDAAAINIGLPQYKLPKGKPNSARSRLAAKVFGNRRSNAAAPAKPKKPVASSTSGSTTGMVTNISAGKVMKQTANGGAPANDLDSYMEQPKLESVPAAAKLEPKIEPRIVDVKPDGKVIRALLRGMLRYGDLTDVGIVRANRSSYADDYRLANFVVRSHLTTTTKMSEEKLLSIATEITDRVSKCIEDKQDVMKFADVEIKPSQVVERLYENLKLRVAVQRAMRDASVSSSGVNGAYVLIAKQCDLPILGIPKDFPPWTWAEKEHDWNSKKDTALLLGIHVHGFGGWEDILNDDLLHMQQQRALKGERLKKRAENLLKRLPPPDDSGEPRIVHAASILAAGPQNANQSLGAQLSAIINNGSSKGRMQRAAERFAARQTGGGGSSEPKTSGVAEDSIRRSHTQHTSSGASERPRKPSISSPPLVAGRSAAHDDEPEDGEIGSATAVDDSKPRRKRSASIDRSANSVGTQSPRKKSKPHHKETENNHHAGAAVGRPMKPALNEEECLEKWKPSKKLKDIRQILKKMKIMADWSKNQKDEVVVEKVYKYITTIGSAIDELVVKEDERITVREWDELCTCLWTYAASFTPFSSVVFEQLYDDICTDGEMLRQEAHDRSAVST